MALGGIDGEDRRHVAAEHSGGCRKFHTFDDRLHVECGGPDACNLRHLRVARTWLSFGASHVAVRRALTICILHAVDPMRNASPLSPCTKASLFRRRTRWCLMHPAGTQAVAKAASDHLEASLPKLCDDTVPDAAAPCVPPRICRFASACCATNRSRWSCAKRGPSSRANAGAPSVAAHAKPIMARNVFFMIHPRNSRRPDHALSHRPWIKDGTFMSIRPCARCMGPPRIRQNTAAPCPRAVFAYPMLAACPAISYPLLKALLSDR